MENTFFPGAKGQLMPATIWEPEEQPKLILQIVHGMTEHIGRYQMLAKELNAAGIVVAGPDLRGHGRNAGDPDVASFGETGWEDSLEDIHLFYQYLEDRFPGIPHFLLGFSLGSFLVREYLEKDRDSIAGAIIMGTSEQPAMVMSLMMALVSGQIKKAGFDSTTKLVRELSFGSYNKQFAPNRTEADWLCADSVELDAYLQDPLCRKNISSGLFWQLLGSMKRTSRKQAYDTWKKDLPILLLSGAEDPVGNSGKCIAQLYQKMRRSGMQDVTMQLLLQSRHDILHEEATVAGEARTIIRNWLADNVR